VANEGGFQSNFLWPVGVVLWSRLRSFRVIGSLGKICEKSLVMPTHRAIEACNFPKTNFLL
jgi:hypothetical protein